MKVVDYLSPEEITRLSSTCKRLNNILPRFLRIRGADFQLDGPHGGNRAPEHYFNGPALETKVKSMKSSVFWKDQGWGNRKGRIFVKLIRPQAKRSFMKSKRKPTEIAMNDNMFGIVAEHEWKTSTSLLVDDDVVKLAQPGDYYCFMRDAGGGGGHTLFVNKFTVLLELVK